MHHDHISEYFDICLHWELLHPSCLSWGKQCIDDWLKISLRAYMRVCIMFFVARWVRNKECSSTAMKEPHECASSLRRLDYGLYLANDGFIFYFVHLMIGFCALAKSWHHTRWIFQRTGVSILSIPVFSFSFSNLNISTSVRTKLFLMTFIITNH